MSMIHLIRHGQASFGRDDYDVLSPLGLRQARILAGFLYDTGFRPDAVYCGTMRRQSSTAEEVVRFFVDSGSPLPQPIKMPEFDEYDTKAIVTAMYPAMVQEDPSIEDDLPRLFTSRQAFKRIFEAAMLRWACASGEIDGVESWEGLKSRVTRGLEAIRGRHGRGRTVAVFTSGGAISACLASVLGLSGETAMRINWQIVNTSITRLMYNEERTTLAAFNVMSHLELAGGQDLVTYR
jgi:broad specificity phosphatase PhoE